MTPAGCPLGCPHPYFEVLSARVSAPVRTTPADTSFTQFSGMSAPMSAPVRTQIVRLSVRSRVLERLAGGHGADNSSISTQKQLTRTRQGRGQPRGMNHE